MKKVLLIFFAVVALVKVGFTQNDWVVFDTSNSDMPDNVVNEITIDLSGNVWIATYGGVAKFDGVNYTVYNTSNSIIPSNVCYSIMADADTIWIGSVYGLVKYDGTNWTNYPYGYVISMAFEPNGNKWFGGYETGLVNYDGTNWTTYNTSNSSLLGSTIYSIAIDNANNKWFATEYGLLKFDGINWTNYNTTNSSLPFNRVDGIAIDNNQNKWLSMSDKGIAMFDNVSCTVYDTSNSGLPDNLVNAEIDFDNNGNKWIGTVTGGLAKFDNSYWVEYSTSNSGLPGNYILSIATDQYENKWIGTYGNGLAVFREGGVILSDKNNSLMIERDKYILYPNPATTQLHIQSTEKITSLQIFDITGREIYTALANKQASALPSREEIKGCVIDVSTLQPGIYVFVFNGSAARKVLIE